LNDLDYLLNKDLEEHLEVLINNLSRGAPSDYSEYCRLVGEIRGIRYALDALVGVRKQLSIEEEV
jgi:hypothetical protein